MKSIAANGFPFALVACASVAEDKLIPFTIVRTALRVVAGPYRTLSTYVVTVSVDVMAGPPVTLRLQAPTDTT
ncbi:Uncharacterised protein [Mycobacteroides abscessus subsp. abscessus]|jgi:hypothetical protein|nr:Uncharacterised protein [Mycobacteroides abscessus subsp. abscessus]SKL79356.1 Uncharacterised protein [Mycobacteroides abscessus subsp. abscessus]SKM53922.1 Uncharacterised protein [Mycobacteroides abscessus subsp. abscessus]SLK35069.1 Uncharacterised protein [Mycobacteroides abscessus subsp. abscessus]